ncbi:ArsR/SmtB family transcription factor [Allonocardiopsis opalescens]|uniref:ArsR family transcriptional regulator n=1 Tax=Allonocardiopsis opalescens TaxID=1144618 RepID=A0A2T0PY35_9ACTN|nr:metalloregulator ArsR/SmtB family transcription factor [Allonocardiopsis opalescens]PRX96378.1 ArsR family transcriptional regulator [Allonocardiopsis opalescens]
MTEMDAVFKALADPSRRRLLDRLNQRNGQSLRELTAGLDMTRQAVTKHLSVLEEARLVTTRRQGREKLHYLNAAPIDDIAERWIGRYHRERARALADLKRALEDPAMEQSAFVYVSYIRTTPQRLWQALTDPAFTRRYFDDTGPDSDWAVGSPVRWRMSPGDEPRDLGQVVLESDPPRRLSYTWHTMQPEHQEMLGLSDEEFAKAAAEERSRVTFELEPSGDAVKLTVTHDGFAPGSVMRSAISQGWPAILSNLKTLVETGETLASPSE